MTLVTVNQIEKNILMIECDIYLLKMLRGMKLDGFYLTSYTS